MTAIGEKQTFRCVCLWPIADLSSWLHPRSNGRNWRYEVRDGRGVRAALPIFPLNALRSRT